MDGGSIFGFGDFSDDPDGVADGVDVPQRGWLPPEDRLWRHPSEAARLGLPKTIAPLLEVDGASVRSRRSSLTAGVVGAAVVAAAVAVSLSMLDTTGSGVRTVTISATSTSFVIAPSKAPSTTAMTASRDVVQLVSAMRPSLVSIVPAGTNGTAASMTGVVLPGGALVLTAATAVAGASQMEVLTSDGKRRRGTVVGTDPHAGVAVITTDGGLSPATFADDVVSPGELAVAACLCHSAATSTGVLTTSTTWAVGMVRQVGTPVALPGGGALVDAIEAEAPLGPAAPGGVLLDGQGHVIGIMDGQVSNGSEHVGVFVPSALAQGVALQLATHHRVDHGWLGVVCADQRASGAMVKQVLPGSPAVNAGLRPGDVVVAVGSHPVSTLADLQARLYTMPPGAPAQLTVTRGEASALMTVTLANAPDN